MNSNYLLICKDKSDNGKRLQRRFRKQNINKLFQYSYYKSDYETESLSLISKFLSDIKTKQKSFNYKNPNYLGVLTDNNVILIKDFISVPEFPDTWDIVFLEYTLDQIKYKSSNNIAWERVQISDTRHFLINPYSLDKIQSAIGSSKNWNEFIKNINTLNVYGIQNMFFSEPKSRNITNYSHDNIELIYNNSTDCKMINYKSCVERFANVKSKYTTEKLYNMYPCISFICCITDAKLFLHTLYTFLSLDYPTDKIELIVIDDIGAETILKRYLPNDSRLRFVNIKVQEQTVKNNKTNENDPKTFPLGYKINLAIKYCKYDLLCHLFDTNIYFKQDFKKIVECYILSNKTALASIDTHSYNPTTKNNFVKRIPDLGNMIYKKSFWASFNFKTRIEDQHVLAYEFTKFRKSEISYIPGIEWSFNIVKNDNVNLNKLPFNLIDLLDDQDKNSFKTSIDIKNV